MRNDKWKMTNKALGRFSQSNKPQNQKRGTDSQERASSSCSYSNKRNPNRDEWVTNASDSSHESPEFCL